MATKSLYEEALIDAKKLREAAEAHAKDAVLQTVAPRIKQMIEEQLLGESDQSDDDDDQMLLEPEDDVKEAVEEQPIVAEEAKELKAESNVTAGDLIMNEASLKIENAISRLEKDLEKFVGSSNIIKKTATFSKMVAELVERVEDTYLYVRDDLNESVDKKHFQNKLERVYEAAQRLKESTMKRNMLDEAGDLVLKVSGLPDDLDVDTLGIEVSTEDVEGDEEAPAEPAVDDVDLDVGMDDEAPAEDEEPALESAMLEGLDDADVIEISESALRNEIARLRSLRLKKEGKMPLDAFGGGEDAGEPFVDGEVTTKDGLESSDDSAKMSESVMGEEEESLDELGLKRKEDEFGSEDANQHSVRAESKKMSKPAVADRGARQLRSESVANRRSPQVADKNSEAESLRRKLNESNLFNAKLIASNKLLQNESLSAKQKRSAIERLDDAESVREVKLVYESIVRALSGRRKVDESRVIGSSSKPVGRSSAAPMNESVDNSDDSQVARWQVLAGLNKK